MYNVNGINPTVHNHSAHNQPLNFSSNAGNAGGNGLNLSSLLNNPNVANSLVQALNVVVQLLQGGNSAQAGGHAGHNHGGNQAFTMPNVGAQTGNQAFTMPNAGAQAAGQTAGFNMQGAGGQTAGFNMQGDGGQAGGQFGFDMQPGVAAQAGGQFGVGAGAGGAGGAGFAVQPGAGGQAGFGMQTAGGQPDIQQLLQMVGGEAGLMQMLQGGGAEAQQLLQMVGGEAGLQQLLQGAGGQAGFGVQAGGAGGQLGGGMQFGAGAGGQVGVGGQAGAGGQAGGQVDIQQLLQMVGGEAGLMQILQAGGAEAQQILQLVGGEAGLQQLLQGAGAGQGVAVAGGQGAGFGQQQLADFQAGAGAGAGAQAPGGQVPVNPDPFVVQQGAAEQQATPVAVQENAKVWGDPHFVGAEGGKYDIKGDNDAVYNLLSDRGVQVNSTFKNNLMQDYGVTLGQDQLTFNKAGELTINGEKAEDGEHLNGAVSKKGKTLTVATPEYNIKMESKGNYMDINFKSDNVAQDGVMPHGLWGQTADGDGKARKGSDTDGTGAIEKLDGGMAEKGDKTYQSYEVNNLHDINFQNFNKFWGETNAAEPAPVAAAAVGGAE